MPAPPAFRGMAALCLAVALAAGAAAAAGVFLRGDGGSAEAVSVRGDHYRYANSGVYRYNEIGVVAEGIGWDVVTLTLAVPALLAALPFVARGSFRGRLFAVGLLGYFCYQYLMYSVAWAFGPLFPAFVVIYAASLAGIAWIVSSIGVGTLAGRFSDRFPRKGMAILCLVLAGVLTLMWLARIADALEGSSTILQGQTTLVVQALDLGLIVPLSVATAVTVLLRRPVGYLLSAALVVKAVTMATAICAMLAGDWIVSRKLDLAPLLFFGAAAAAALVLGLRVYRSVLTPSGSRAGASC